MTDHVRADRVRLAIGAACVLAAAWLFATRVPQAVRSMNASVRSDAYVENDPTERVLTSGDILGIPFRLQLEALTLIPKRSDYALLLPPSEQDGAPYGIAPITYATVGPFLRYLLLPALPVSPSVAHYVICWGCDTAPWDHRTTWLWNNDQGQAIGRVRR